MRFPTQAGNWTKIFENPLDKFRTYSYHHIWAIGNNTQTLVNLFNDPEQVLLLFEDGTLKDPNTGFRKITGDYTVFINTNSDLDFTIDTVTFHGTAVGQSVTRGANTVADLNGTIEVKEYQGAKFFNVIRQIYGELGISPSATSHCLKTIIVGQTYEGVNEVIIDIPPIFFMIAQVKMAVTNKGSEYTINFCHMASVGMTGPIAKSGTGIQVTLQGTVRDQLDDVARQYSLNSQRTSGADPSGNSTPIKYRIELDSTISEVGGWKLNYDKSIRTQGKVNNQTISYSGSVPIESIIHDVFRNCPEYIKQRTARTPESFQYKIIPFVDMSKSGECTSLYRITKDEVGKTEQLNASTLDRASIPDPADRFGPDDRVLIYDYIFTGKNTDIEDLDLAIDDGFAFYSIVTATTNVSEKKGEAGNTNVIPVANAKSSELPITKTTPAGEDQPVPAVKTIAGQPTVSKTIGGKHHPSERAKVEYDQVVENAMTLEAAKMGMSLTIRGNPGYLSCFALQPNKTKDLQSTTKVAGTNQGTGTIFNELPKLYVNIMMPTSGTAAGGDRLNPEFEPFWYKGLWQVLEVDSVFTGGRFYNKLTLLAIPTPLPATPSTQPNAGSSNQGIPKTPDAPVPKEGDQPRQTPPPPKTPPPTEGTKEFYIGLVSPQTQLTTNFTLGDFIRTSTVPNWQTANMPPTQEHLDNIVFTARELQKIRDKLGTGIVITSGYRSPEVNRRVGGVATSDHAIGLAADFVSPGFGTPKMIVDAIKDNTTFKQLILETPPGRNPWVHIGFTRSGTPKQQVLQYFGKVGGKQKYSPYKGTT